MLTPRWTAFRMPKLTRVVCVLVAILPGCGRVARGLQTTDLSREISAQDAALGAGPGTITVDHPGRLVTPLTLHRGHSLSLRTAVSWEATVRLEGNNTVQCASAARMIPQMPAFVLPQATGALLTASGTTGIRIEGCVVSSSVENLLFLASGVSDLTLSGNTLTGVDLLATTGADASNRRIVLKNNVVTGGPNGSKYAGVQLANAEEVEVAGNSFTHLIHGAMWWGGDSAAAGMGPAKVVSAGKMAFIGNHCKQIAGSCLWGSMGHDIVMQGNSASGCGDVCFDAEGGVRTQIVQNEADGCINGCAGVFFFTDQTTISGNHFHAQVPGGGLIFIKNSSQDPLRHDHMTIENNDLRCEPKVCRAVYQEAAGGIRFAGNEVVNGTWLPVGYGRSVTIANNHLLFTQALTGGEAAIAAPGVLGGTALQVAGNRIESNVAQPAGSACVAAGWTDYNFTDYHLIAGNVCGGQAPFPVGVRVVTAGKNPGVAGVWVLSANRLGGGALEHPTGAPNERYFDLGQCGATGCQVNQGAVNAVRALPGCTGKMTGAAGTMAVCLGATTASVPLPR